jgi:hypothetical protein
LSFEYVCERGLDFLEQYDAYCERAKLYTEIHAKQKMGQDSKASCCAAATAESRKRGENAADQDKKDKKGKLMTKDKKRTLKRL